ncbi:hypothetical protein SALBM311S_10979 [Streptomyces alboniger]
MVRARWAATLQDSPLMSTAAAFESVTDELTFVVGPLLATALCTAVDPAAGLLTEASLTLLGGLLFAAQKSTQPTVAADGHARVEHTSALRIPGVRVLIVAFLGIGSVFGGMQVSLAAFSESIGEPGLNGVLYGTFAAGNTLAGLVCGAIAWKVTPRRRLLVGYAALALTASGLWAAHSVLVAGRPRPARRHVRRARSDHRLHPGRGAGPGRRPHRGVHLADRSGGARPGGGRHDRRTAGGPLLGRRRVLGPDGRHAARAGDLAGAAFATHAAARDQSGHARRGPSRTCRDR